MPVTNMAEAVCLLPPPHEHRPVTKADPAFHPHSRRSTGPVPQPGHMGSAWGIRTFSTVLLV